MSNKTNLVPRLRFPEFQTSGSWRIIPLQEVCEINPTKKVKNDNDLVSFVPMAAVSEDGKIRRPEVRAYFEVKKGYTCFLNNDVIIAKITPCFENGKAAFAEDLINGTGYGSTEFHVFRAKEGCLPKFLFQQLYRAEIRTAGEKDMVGNAGQRRVPPSFFEMLSFYLPSLLEQKKIAECLSSLDEVIEAQTQKLEVLKKHKKALMQRLFPTLADAGSGVIPRLRFPEFKNAETWRIIPLEYLAKRRIQKNTDEICVRVLTNSAEYGVIDQREYFDRDIVNQKNLAGYYIVELGDYVYNPRCSVSAPVGPISRNAIGTGVMSPLYTVFRFEIDDNIFFAHYFKSENWHLYLRQISSTGVRHDRMSISNDDFMRMPIPVPTLKEQRKIADCLSSLDDVIEARNQKIAALKNHKKSLLQQLFPNIFMERKL